MKNRPPRLFHRFFRWYCNPHYLDHIEGDLLENHHFRTEKLGVKKANLKFIIDVIRLCRPSIIRPFKRMNNINTFMMYSSYFKSTFRHLATNKTFSLINISGLALGLTCSILIGLWVNDEINIDNFHNDIDRIFVVTSVEYSGDEINGSYDTPGPLGEELPKIIPEVEYASSYGWSSYHTFALADKKLRMQGTFAEEDFFRIFSYPMIVGKVGSLLKSPESIVISRKMATTFFGSPEQAINKTLRFETYLDLKITGVFEDIDTRSSDQFEYVVAWKLMMDRNPWMKDWHNSGPTTYLKVSEHADIKTVQTKLQHFIKGYDKAHSDLDRLELGMQPFGERYLHSNFKDGKIAGGRIEYVNLFRIVAVFIVLIACINFMNLSTARSIRRAKEIGVRKVIGAFRGTIMQQFAVEAMIFTLFAVVIALAILTLILPTFNLLTEKSIASPFLHLKFWMAIGALTLVTAFVAGSYPAIVLSAFKPAAVLKSSVTPSRSSSGYLRKTLVVLQFSLSMIFIVGMIIISQQVDYIQTKNVGYSRSNLVCMPITGSIATNFEAYRNVATQVSGVTGLTRMAARPFDIGNSTGDVEWEGKDPVSRPTFTQCEIGYDFIQTMESELVQGREFSTNFNDSSNFIVNETALRIMGYKDPLGMPLRLWDIKGKIVGVIKDFHFSSLHVPIEPLLLRLAKGEFYGWTMARIDPAHAQEAFAGLEATHAKFSPNVPFTYQFVDDEYGLQYRSEKMVSQLSRFFAGLAIFISCLGLLGSVIFTAEQRTKEVSIRKILGANVAQIIALLSGDFIKLVGIAAVISLPVGYYVMLNWLTNFEYHVDIQWWVFLIAGLGAIAIAVVTVLYQAFRTAVANPVDSLKTD